MSDFEERLARSLTEGAEGAPDAAGLAAGARGRARSRRRRTVSAAGAAVAVAAIVVPLAVVAARDNGPTCGTDPDSATSALDAQQVTCGGASWDVAAMDGGLPGLVDEGAVRGAFARILTEAPMDAPEAIREQGADAAPWIALASDAEGYTLGIGTWTTQGPGADADVAVLETQPDDSLRMTSWGDCRLEVALPDGQSRVQVTAPTGGVDGAVTDPVVMVNEVQCAGARDPEPYLSDPVVVEDDDRVVVTMSSDAVEGNAFCQANPVVPFTLRLDEPIGDRELLDGGTWPATPLAVANPGEGWQTLVHEGEPVNEDDEARVVFDVPDTWERLDTSGCEFEFARYGPADGDPCSEIGVLVVGSATFDPKFGPGLRPASDYGDTEGEWLGYVYTGQLVVDVQTDDKQLALRILGSVRSPGETVPDLSGEWALVNEQGVSYEVPPRGRSELSVRVVERPGNDDTSAYARADGAGQWLATMTLPNQHQIRVTAPTRALAELIAGSAGTYPVD